MSYAERAFFDGDPCQHVAAYHEDQRLRRIERAMIRAQASREWDALPDTARGVDRARAHLAAMPAERRRQLEQEWQA